MKTKIILIEDKIEIEFEGTPFHVVEFVRLLREKKQTNVTNVTNVTEHKFLKHESTTNPDTIILDDTAEPIVITPPTKIADVINTPPKKSYKDKNTEKAYFQILNYLNKFPYGNNWKYFIEKYKLRDQSVSNAFKQIIERFPNDFALYKNNKMKYNPLSIKVTHDADKISPTLEMEYSLAKSFCDKLRDSK